MPDNTVIKTRSVTFTEEMANSSKKINQVMTGGLSRRRAQLWRACRGRWAGLPRWT
jgi:hypothetical protein